jgi:hypothetical protein
MRTDILVLNRPWLFHNIDLEPDEVGDGTVVFPSDRDHGQQIHKRLPAVPIIDQADLRFLLLLNHLSEIAHGVIVNIFALHTGIYFAVGILEKSAILSYNFRSLVAGEALEVIGAVNYRHILCSRIAHYEGAGQIYVSYIDLRIGSLGHTVLAIRVREKPFPALTREYIPKLPKDRSQRGNKQT